MTEASELERLLEQHQAIRGSLPSSWSAFFARFGALRPVQLAAVPPVLAGENVLITAPTAGGKTEAVMAPLCERIVAEAWQGLSTILVTPTRSLVNDLFARLEVPCGQMGIRLDRKTADHAAPFGDVQLLVTTPESLESLLTFRRERLSGLRTLIIDEVHLLEGTPRGDQLRLLLGRLRRYLAYVHRERPRPFQVVAVSATVPAPERTARTFLGPQSRVVTVAGQREIMARVVRADGDDEARARAAMQAAEEFADARKLLIFVNSRKQVDLGAEHFRCGRFAQASVYCHHGNLSKPEREAAEARFKQDPFAVCVATMTLEVGIDIGDVDLVVCVDPPFSLSSFLQRIGRGCRRLQGKTRVLCVARDRAGELIFEGLVEQARLGIPPGPVVPLRRSVLVQQVLAYLRQVEVHRRTADQFREVFCVGDAPAWDAVEQVLGDMVTSGLLAVHNGVFEPATEGREFIESSQIYANIAPPPYEITLVDVETGRPVASVAGIEASKGVRVAGRSFELLPDVGSTRRVRAGGDYTALPQYHARKLPYAFDVGASLARRMGVPEGTLMVVRAGERLFVMTWLGRLLNTCLAAGAGLERVEMRPAAFCVDVSAQEPASLIPLLRRIVTRLRTENPLGGCQVERLADLGPHFRLLSDDVKSAAREDWLDGSFLDRWAGRLTNVELVDADAVADLYALCGA